MSFTFVRDIKGFEKKTLIYFTSLIPIFIIPGSYTYIVTENLWKFVNDLRYFAIQNFPIICYDDGDMILSSRAYCILKSMNYEVSVLYGGLKACEEEGLSLIPYQAEPIEILESPKEIDSSKLYSTQINCFNVKSLPFSIYDVIGKNISVEKLRKLLETNGICINHQNKVLAGPSACLMALVLTYFGENFPSIYLGDWFDSRLPARKLTSETFQTPGTVYFDAEEDLEVENQISNANEEEFKNESVLVTFYKIPYIEPNRASIKYSYEKETFKCKSCILL